MHGHAKLEMCTWKGTINLRHWNLDKQLVVAVSDERKSDLQNKPERTQLSKTLIPSVINKYCV